MSAQVEAIYMMTPEETLKVYDAASGWTQFPDVKAGDPYSFEVEVRNLSPVPTLFGLKVRDRNGLDFERWTSEEVNAGDTAFIDVTSTVMPERANRTLFEVHSSLGQQQQLETIIPIGIGKPPELPFWPGY